VVKDPVPAPEAPAKSQHTAAAPSSEKTSDTTAKKSTPAPAKNSLKDSGNTYLVAKGDKLATIAKKLHVNPDDLMKLNKIDDPKKLQIGQKLRVPAKRPVSDA
jgi:2',3'-cyclic-nucleotide 2'-phosphodiesterase/3'-nucleotidase